MAETTPVAEPATPLPSTDEIERAAAFTREPFVLEGEDAGDALAPGTPAPPGARRRAGRARRRARRSRRVAGAASGRCCSGSSACSPRTSRKLVDGTVLSAHQVDALSGTLTALLAEAQRNGNGERQRRRRRPEPASSSPRSASRARRTTTRTTTSPRSRRTGRTRGRRGRRAARRGARGPQRRQALLVRARDRRRQDRRRARLRRGLAHRRHPDPHPPPQPRRPVPRRAARPRLREADRAGAARRRGPRRRPGDGRDLPVVRPQRRATISDAYTIVICDEAHTALGEKTSAVDPQLDRPDLRRHDRDGRADRPPRHRPLPDADLALRPRAGRAPRRHLAAALRAHPARARACGRSPRCRCAAARSTPSSTRRCWPSCSISCRSTSRSPTSTRRASTACPASSTPPACATPTTSPQAFRDLGLKAQAVSGETPKRELAQILARYERGDIDVLVNAQLLAEGWNSPRATVCMHLAPTASKRIYQQRVGRVTRRHPGKEAGIVVDFVHPATKHDDPVVTLHSLLDRDVYRGGAIVVGPVRRGRGRRLRVERRVLPVTADENRRIEVFERELWRIAVEHLDYGEQVQWAALAGARVAPTGWRRARAMLHFDQGGELKRTFLITAVDRNKNPQLRLRALQEIAVGARRRGVRPRAGLRRVLAARRQARGRQGRAAGAGREEDRPPRPGQQLDLALREHDARGPRGVRRPALAGDQAPARPARELLGRRARAQRAPARARRAPAGPAAVAPRCSPPRSRTPPRPARSSTARARACRASRPRWPASCCATSRRASGKAKRRRRRKGAGRELRRARGGRGRDDRRGARGEPESRRRLGLRRGGRAGAEAALAPLPSALVAECGDRGRRGCRRGGRDGRRVGADRGRGAAEAQARAAPARDEGRGAGRRGGALARRRRTRGRRRARSPSGRRASARRRPSPSRPPRRRRPPRTRSPPSRRSPSAHRASGRRRPPRAPRRTAPSPTRPPRSPSPRRAGAPRASRPRRRRTRSPRRPSASAPPSRPRAATTPTRPRRVRACRCRG